MNTQTKEIGQEEIIQKAEAMADAKNGKPGDERSSRHKVAEAFVREADKQFRVDLYAPEGGCGRTAATEYHRTKLAAMADAIIWGDKKGIKIDWQNI